MNLIRCKNGHFYDADKFNECPHCNAVAGSQKDETMAFVQDDDSTTSSLSATVGSDSLQNAVNNAMSKNGYSEADGQKTVGYYSKALGKEPVVGWLVAIEGPHFGEDFRLISGRNFIGRGTNMAVCLSKDGSVSRDKHAIILFDPKQSIYLVQPGDSKELFYLNDEVVLSPEKIKRNDVLLIGETKLMFFPCCDETFSWSQKEGL
ncbi:MAG: FHA domain-containing protein [Eubacteriales bacterium]|nr:FHA domain-containing protein [Eubacteriales bacterium]